MFFDFCEPHALSGNAKAPSDIILENVPKPSKKKFQGQNIKLLQPTGSKKMSAYQEKDAANSS